MNKEPQHSLPAGNSEPSKELVKVETQAEETTEPVHEQTNVTSPINFEKALGSIYEDLSDEDKARLSFALDQDEDLRSLFASMTSGDFGGMLKGMSAEEFDAQAQPYRDLIDNILNKQAGSTTEQRNPAPADDAEQAALAAAAAQDPANDPAPTGRAGVQAHAMVAGSGFLEKWRARRAKKYNAYAEKMRTKGITNESEIEQKFKRRTLLRGAFGAAALVGTGIMAWALFTRNGVDAPLHIGNGSSGGEGGVDDWKMPKAGNGQDIISEQQLDRYFDMPDTADMSDKLHHANDLSPGNPALAAGDMDGAVQNIHEMLRGNSNITAMWASQLDIPGAPEMPSLDALRTSDAAVTEFNTKINEWGEHLQLNPRERAEITQQIVDKLNSGKLVGSETLRPGYMSTGANNTLNQMIYGTNPQVAGTPNEAFIDPSVGYEGVEVKKWLIDGKEILVNDKCNQISYQGPVVEQPTYTPQPETTYIPDAPEVPDMPSTDVPSTDTPPPPPDEPEPPTPPVEPELPVEEEPPEEVDDKIPGQDSNIRTEAPGMGDYRAPTGDHQPADTVTTPDATYDAPAEDAETDDLAPGAQPTAPSGPAPSQQSGSSTGGGTGGSTTTAGVSES